jgi:hypothetical protein
VAFVDVMQVAIVVAAAVVLAGAALALAFLPAREGAPADVAEAAEPRLAAGAAPLAAPVAA